MTVELDACSVSVDGRTVIDSVSWIAGAGEQVSIVGRSGVGKSTLLRAISGEYPLAAGVIRVCGEEVASTPERVAALRRRTLAFLPQDHGLVETLSPIDNMALPLLVGGTRRRQAHDRALELAEELGVDHLARRDLRTLSGGERQRVAVVRTLVARRPIVLADEPTGALDPMTAQSTMDLLVSGARAVGATLLVVTHDLVLADRFGRRAVLAEGHLTDRA